MSTNVFIISDASFDPKKKCAGIGVFDTADDKEYSTTFLNAKNSSNSEFLALVYAVKIAIKKDYKYVVFIYDCKDLNIINLESFVKNRFLSAQFLWLKRDFTQKADNLAKQALILARKINTSTPVKKNVTRAEERVEKHKVIKKFPFYDYKQIISAFLYIAKMSEKIVLGIFIAGNYDINQLPTYRCKDTNIYRFIYHLLEDETRDEFLTFIRKINPLVRSSGFKERPSNNMIYNQIVKIIEGSKK